MKLGETIYRLRTEKNMSQGDLAEALDVSRQSVSKWENDAAVPELDKLVKMSQLFEVTLDELVSGNPAPMPYIPTNDAQNDSLPKRIVAGMVLFVIALFVFLVAAISGNCAGGIALMIPFLMCSVACMLFKRHTAVWVCWALYLPLAIMINPMYIRSDIALNVRFFMRLPLFIYTILVYYREPITLGKRNKLLLSGGMILWLIYFVATVIHRFHPFIPYITRFWFNYLAFPLFCIVFTTLLRLVRRE